MYEDRKKERKKNAKKDWIIDTWGKPFDEEEQTPPPPIPPVDQRIVVPGIGAPRTQANVNPQGWENRIKEAQARLDAAKAALGDKNDTRSTLQKALALKEMEREVRNAKKDSPGVPTQEVIDIAKDSENTIAPDGQVFKKGQNYSTGRIYKNEETGNLEYKKFAAVPTSQVLKGLAIPWGGAIPPIPEDPNQGATPGEKEPWYKAFGEGLMDPVNNLVIGGMNLFNPDPNTAFVPSRSTLRPELQNEYPYMGGSIAGNLALAVPGANIAGTAARGIGLGAGTANVAAGALTGAAMTAPGAYNQAASKAMTPGEAITSTVLGGVGGGTASAIGGALAKKGVGLTTNLAGQAAGDFGVGFGTPFVQAAVNNNELPTIKTAAIQGGVNALTGVGIGTATVFGTGLSNLLNGQKRSNAKAAANNAAAAEVNAQKAAASAEEAKTQTQATAYGQTAATFAKGAGGGDLNAVIGVAPGASPAEAYNTLVGFVQSATNGTVPNRPTEVVKTIKNVMQNGAEPGSKMYQDIVAGNIEGYNLDIVSKTQEKYNSDLATKVKVETTAQLPRIISDAYTTLQQAGIQDLNPNQAIAVAQILTGGKISNAEVAQKKILEYAVGNKSTQSIADGVAAAAGRAQLQSELKTQQAQQSLEQKANTAASKQKEKEGKVAEQNTKALLSNLGVPMPKGADQNLIWQNVAAIYNKDGRFADLNAFVGFAGKTLNDAQSRVGEMGDAEMSDLLLRGVGKVGRLPEIELRNKIAEDMLRTGATADEAVDAIRTQKTPAEQKEAADTQKAAQTGGKTTQPVTSGMIGGGNPGMIYEGGTPPPKSGDYTPGLEAAPVDAPVTVPEAPQVTPHTQALVKSGDGYTVGAPLTGRSQGSLSQLQKTIAATGGQEAVDAIINDSNLQSGLIAVSELQPAVLNKLGAEMGWDFTGMNDSQKRAFVLNEGIKTAEGILDVGEVVKGFGSKAKDVEQESINRSIISGKPIDLDATFGTRKNKPWEKFGIDSSTGTFSQGGKLWTPNSIAIKSAIELNVAPTLKEGAVAGALAGTGGLAGEAAKATKDLRKRTGDKSLTITQLDLAAAYNEAKKKGLIDDTPKHGATSTAKAPLGTQGVHKGLDFNGIKDTSKPSEEGWTPELEADIDAKFDLRFGKIDDPTNRKAVNEAIVNLHNDIEKMFGGLGPDWVYNRTGALLKQFEQKKNSSQQTDTPAGQSSEPTPEITKVDAISPSKYFKASPGAKSVVFKDTSQGSVVDMDAVKSDMPLAYEFLSKHRDANKFTPIDVKNALASAYKRRMRYKVDAENLIAQIRELEVLASQADAGAKTSKDDFKKQMADSRDFTPEQLELYSAMIDGLNTSHMPDYVAGASGDNYYSFATNELVSKEPDVFLHEIGHFSFYNILSPEDRIAYMEYMVDTSYGKNGKSLYGKNGKSLGERLALTSEKITENIDGKETTLIANVGDNFSEYFAEQFRQWYVGEKVTPKEFDNIFAKVADYMRRVLEKLKSGEYIDKNLVLYFEKISPPKPKRTKSRPGSGEPPQKSSAITTADVLLAGIGAYSLYHALAFGDASGLSMAALAAGANSDMVKKGLGGLKQKTSDWIKSYNLKGDSINSAYNTWVQNNSYADEAAKKQALSDIKEQSALRLEGLPNMAFDLNPFHQIAAKNSILGGIRDKGFEMEKHFSGMSTILDDINTWIKKTQQDLVSEVVKLNSDVYNANAAINNDNSIPKDQKAEAKEEATSALLSEAFAKNPELQAEYEKWRNMINEASALQIELQMLNDISAVPSTLDARIDDFTKVADELQFQADDFSSYANNIGKMLRTDKAGAFDKLLVNDMEFRTLYSGKKTVRKKNRKTGVVTEEELDDKNKILIVKKHQKEQRKKANALRRKQRATERMANYHEELEKRKAQSVADHHINLWRAYQAAQRKKMFFGKGRDLQSATLQLRGADGKRYRIYGNNKKSVVEQTASIAGKEGLVMEVEGFALSPTATVDQLSKGWMPKGAIFKDSDGNVWDFNQFAAAHDDYTNTLWSAIDLVTAGIAESKLAKVTAEWLKNNPEQAGDSGELKALRSKITEAAEGRIDAEELRTNLLVMQAQQATEPPKTSTLMPPGTEDGNLAQHIANGLHDLQNDAYRTGRAVGTREQLMTDALEGWDDKLNSYLRRQQEQLATRAAVPFGRNLLTEGMNSLTSASQLLLLALRPATFAVNLVKGTTMSASEFGLGDVMRQLPGFKIDGFNAAWEHAKKTVDTQTANRYYVGEADRGGWVKSVLRGSTAWSQAIADKVTARTATADFVANLSDADAKLLAGGDKGMLRKLDNHVLNSIAMTQGRYQHYDLSPVHQQILRFPMGRAALAFTLPRINELSWVWQNAKNMKDRKSQAKLLRYGMLTAMTVGGLGLPLVADLMSALNSGTGDREELATDKAIADLRKLAIENGVDGETFDNIRKFGAKGAPGALLDTELMSDEETSSLLTMFMVENLIKVGKNIAGNLTDEEKTAAEKILAITEGSMPQLKAVRRTATEASTGTKTDSKGDLIPGSSTDAGRMTQIFLGLGSHTDRQAQKRLKNTDLVTEQGLNKAAENFLDDLQGMSQIIYAGKIINSSKKEANADRRDELFKHITKNKEELRNVIRTANELTEQAEEKIKEAGEKLKSWLKTPVSEVKGLPKRVVEQGGTVEEAMNRTLAISRNPSYNSTKGVVKRMVGSMEDEKYSETSLYGFYRKKAIIEAVNNSKLGVKAYFNPTTKLESGGRLKNVPDAEQAFEYGKNRVISLLQGQVLPE